MPRPRTTSGSSIDDATYSGRCKTFPKSCSACKEAMQVQRCGDDGGTKEQVLDDTTSKSSTKVIGNRAPTKSRRQFNDAATLTFPSVKVNYPTNIPGLNVPGYNSSGLSVGEQAGIGFGVGAVGLGIVVAIILLWRRERRSKRPVEDMHDKPQLDSREVNSLGSSTETTGTVHPENTLSNTGELHVTSARQEFDGTPARYELPP
ncbi:unnamed protein product [Fusarium venenatum]|uniref:Uncharacterized protein n=1 Tax=Fusarium venenatum TaxID=56646 RepID=A0A2L2T2W4_9HYPO|nr:uncharacterized protein FVRRES_06339 [Fusarium venenatum]KAH6993341.1 hypothetical protein EDB82DRAFT_499006 [Fusarium venenatum]CEI61903.1 unnamed protein product [Fusarium venenatum]